MFIVLFFFVFNIYPALLVVQSIVEQGQRLPCYSQGVLPDTTYLRLDGGNLDLSGNFGA